LATLYGIILRMAESAGVTRLRRLVAKRDKASTEVDAQVVALLREGEFVEDIAAALGESREKVRRTRKTLGIPDAREIRRAKGAVTRRSAVK
jgi:transposase-like protein